VKRRITWFEFGLALFAAAVPIGVLLILAAPVAFLQALGALILGTGLVGIWVSALGLRLEHPERWHALKRLLRGSVAAAPSARRTVEP
jgi:hypothetical protein